MNEVIILCLWINNRIFAAIFLNDILMNYGYVKVAAAVPRVKVADCKFNAMEIEKEIIIAEGKGVQIIAFPYHLVLKSSHTLKHHSKTI